MRLSDFDYELPDALIARHPPAQRGTSRLLDVCSAPCQDRLFADLPALLAPGDLLVFNDTRVLKARLQGRKASGGRVEVMVERPLQDGEWVALIRASKSPPAGSLLFLEGPDGAEAQVRVLGREQDLYRIRLETGAGDLLEWMARAGSLPLPPYLERDAEADDDHRYQTVYAREPGAVAAPTAGLHFSEALLEALRARGVELAYLTLHVGAGTFLPVRCDDVREHRMHAERYWVPQATRDAIAAARARGGRVIAVGTTSLRALEAAALEGQDLEDRDQEGRDQAAQDATAQEGSQAPARGVGHGMPAAPRCVDGMRPASAPPAAARPALRLAPAGDTRLFITPGFRFQVVDRLLTNFHLPRSTLLMLVQAFGGIARLRAAYAHAVAAQYRFFSYGDAMLIDGDPGVQDPGVQHPGAQHPGVRDPDQESA